MVERSSPVTTDALRDAAERVCWFDWSGNDTDAVAAIDALREVVTAAPSSSSAEMATPLNRDKIWHAIAKHIACESDCQKWPNGCGCAQNAADELVSMLGVAQTGPVQEAFAYISENVPALAGAKTQGQVLNIIQNWLAMTSTECDVGEELRTLNEEINAAMSSPERP